LGRSWYERGQYANVIKEILSLQIQCYKKEPDSIKKTKIAQSIGYLGQTVNSMISSQEEIGFKSLEPETEGVSITEEMVKEVVRYQILEELKQVPSKDEILQEIIKFKKCDLKYASIIYAKMEELGLKTCKSGYRHDLHKFATMRNYTTDEELTKAKRAVWDRDRNDF